MSRSALLAALLALAAPAWAQVCEMPAVVDRVWTLTEDRLAMDTNGLGVQVRVSGPHTVDWVTSLYVVGPLIGSGTTVGQAATGVYVGAGFTAPEGRNYGVWVDMPHDGDYAWYSSRGEFRHDGTAEFRGAVEMTFNGVRCRVWRDDYGVMRCE